MAIDFKLSRKIGKQRLSSEGAAQGEGNYLSPLQSQIDRKILPNHEYMNELLLKKVDLTRPQVGKLNLDRKQKLQNERLELFQDRSPGLEEKKKVIRMAT